MSKTKWGQLDNILFEFLTSPVYNSYKTSKKYNYNYSAVIGRQPQKNSSADDLKTCSFSLKFISFVLNTSSQTAGQRALSVLGFGGSVAGNSLKKTEIYDGLYINADMYLKQLEELAEKKQPLVFFKGNSFLGYYTINSLSVSYQDFANGATKTMVVDIEIEEVAKQDTIDIDADLRHGSESKQYTIFKKNKAV